MVVESDGSVQDVFREGFRRAGYRVLVTADPVRAVNRFRQDASVANCVIFNAQQIGQPALEMFNVLGADKETASIPAILLLDEIQQKWKLHAHTARHRIVLVMPVTMKQLRTLVAHLVPPETHVATGGAYRPAEKGDRRLAAICFSRGFARQFVASPLFQRPAI